MSTNNFKQLLLTAIGTNRTQTQFAADCGISRIHLGRMLKDDYDGEPSQTTLEKIADHSAGQVTVAELKESLGITITESDTKKENYYNLPYARRNAIQSENIRLGIRDLTNKPQKYHGISAITEIIDMLYTWGNQSMHYIADADQVLTESESKEHHGAEYCSNLYVTWEDDDCKVEFGCLLFYCRTVSSGIIITDTAFDVKTLYNYKNKVAKEIKDGLTCGDEEINPDDCSLCYITTVKNKTKEFDVKSDEFNAFVAKLETVADDYEKKVVEALIYRLE